jgi:hypothetical protein
VRPFLCLLFLSFEAAFSSRGPGNRRSAHKQTGGGRFTHTEGNSRARARAVQNLKFSRGRAVLLPLGAHFFITSRSVARSRMPSPPRAGRHKARLASVPLFGSPPPPPDFPRAAARAHLPCCIFLFFFFLWRRRGDVLVVGVIADREREGEGGCLLEDDRGRGNGGRSHTTRTGR